MSLQAGPLITLTGTSPSAAGTSILQTYTTTDLTQYECFKIFWDLIGATGGTLNVGLEINIAPNVWHDLSGTPQLASAAAAIRYTSFCGSGHIAQAPFAVARGTDATSNTLITTSTSGGPWGSQVRLVATAGASTSAGALVTCYIQPYRVVPRW